jgi:hypothetical protein
VLAAPARTRALALVTFDDHAEDAEQGRFILFCETAAEYLKLPASVDRDIALRDAQTEAAEYIEPW